VAGSITVNVSVNGLGSNRYGEEGPGAISSSPSSS
jgi:hypothetical protein